MASNTFSVKVKGLREIDKALRKIPRAAADAALMDALAAGAEVIAKEARRRAPIDTSAGRNPNKTHLKDAIKVGNKKKLGRFNVTMDVGIDYTFAGGAVRHGHLVEFGHGGPHPASPHPFMRPAFDGKGREAIAIFRNRMWASIKRETRRG